MDPAKQPPAREPPGDHGRPRETTGNGFRIRPSTHRPGPPSLVSAPEPYGFGPRALWFRPPGLGFGPVFVVFVMFLWFFYPCGSVFVVLHCVCNFSTILVPFSLFFAVFVFFQTSSWWRLHLGGVLGLLGAVLGRLGGVMEVF